MIAKRFSRTGGCKLQVAGHCSTITETTQTFSKMLTIGENIIFGPNVNISKGLGCFTYGETMTCDPNLQPAGYTLQSTTS